MVNVCLSSGDENVQPHALDSYQDASCLQQPFAELCNRNPVVMGRWMLHIVDGCTVIYTNIHSTSSAVQQTILLNNCRAIYQCWFAFENESVCFYYKSSNEIPAEPNALFYLVLMAVRDGVWVLLHSPESVFTPGHYAGTISSSVDLYGTIDDESDSKAAVFLIGKKRYVYRIELLFLPVPVAHLRRAIVCEQHHRVIQIVTTKHDTLVICDNKVYWITIDPWDLVEVTTQEFTDVIFTRASFIAYISESSDTSIGLIALNNFNNTTYCFIGRPSQHPLGQCGVISNVSLSHGLLITRNDIANTQLLALFGGEISMFIGVISTSSSNSYETINTDFCHPQDNCSLVQTENNVYIDNEQEETMLLDRATLEVIATYNINVYEVLPMVENATHQHTDLPSPSPSNTSTSTIMVNSNTSVTYLTVQITTSTDVTVKTISVSLTSALAFSTVSTTMPSASISVTSTSNIDMDTSSTSDMNISTDPTTDAATTSEPSGGTSATESSSGANNTNNTISNNVTDPDTRPESGSGMLVIVITVASVLILFILLLVGGIFAGKCYDVRLSKSCSPKRSIPQTEAQQSDNYADKIESRGEMVMPTHDTKIYVPLSSNTSTKTTKITTMVETTVNTEHKILVK